MPNASQKEVACRRISPSLDEALSSLNDLLAENMPTIGVRLDLSFAMMFGALKDLPPKDVQVLLPKLVEKLYALAREAGASVPSALN